MVKDKVFQMEDGKSYYIMDSIDYNGSKYALALECDLDKDEVNEDDYVAMEISILDGDLFIKRIEDDYIANVVVGLLLNKIKNS